MAFRQNNGQSGGAYSGEIREFAMNQPLPSGWAKQRNTLLTLSSLPAEAVTVITTPRNIGVNAVIVNTLDAYVVIGGSTLSSIVGNPNGVSASVTAYNKITLQETILPSLPVGLNSLDAVLLGNGKIFVIGHDSGVPTAFISDSINITSWVPVPLGSLPSQFGSIGRITPIGANKVITCQISTNSLFNVDDSTWLPVGTGNTTIMDIIVKPGGAVVGFTQQGAIVSINLDSLAVDGFNPFTVIGQLNIPSQTYVTSVSESENSYAVCVTATSGETGALVRYLVSASKTTLQLTGPTVTLTGTSQGNGYVYVTEHDGVMYHDNGAVILDWPQIEALCTVKARKL